nr:MAG TPA: ethylene-responsive transcription factor [Bacteriophage sp.]
MKGVKLDLVGQRFGRLTVLERLESNGGKYVYWRCKCDCGNIVDVATRGLRSSGTVSCGCNRREKAEKNFGTISLDEKLGRSDGCNFARLRSSKPQKNNTTGYRGVVRTPSGRYYTAVYYKGKQYHAKGTFDTAEDAYNAAEKLREELIARYKTETDVSGANREEKKQ